jgi:hypothetical protein
MEDNRKTSRVLIHWRSAIVIEENGKQAIIHGRTHDMSVAGVSVICHYNFSPSDLVTVYLLVNTDDQNNPQLVVEARGKVMYSILSGQQGGFRIGIQFLKFAGEGKQILRKYLPQDVAPAADVVPTKNAAPTTDVPFVRAAPKT